MEPARRQQLTVNAGKNAVHIGECQHECHWLTIDFGNPVERCFDNGPQFFTRMGDFCRSEGHKAPIGRPCIVQYAKDRSDFLVIAFQVYGPNIDAIVVHA